jgi:type II secretory pathway component PulF
MELGPASRSGRRRWLSKPNRRLQAEVTAFIRELGTLVRAGIPLLDALGTLAQQHSRTLRPVIQELTDEVAAGTGLAEAMSRRQDCFDSLSVSIVSVGENTGSLDDSLLRLAQFKEKSQQLRSRLTTALLYPAVVLVIGLGVTIFLMTYVVPSLLTSLERADRQLPVITQWVKSASDAMVHWWWAMLAGLGLLVAGIRIFAATAAGRRWMDRLLLRIPVLGDLARKENTSRLSVVLAALLRSGLSFVEALRVTRRTIRNTVYVKALEDYEQAVLAGADVSGPLKSSGVFSPMVVQMLAVGQQSGELEEMLDQLAQAYDQQVATAAARLTAVLEPLLIVLLAILVGFIAIATILPILEASNVL